MKQNTYTTEDGTEYTLEELKQMEESWNDKMTEAAKKGDDWGHDMAREKWQEVRAAINELEDDDGDNTVEVDGEEYTEERLESIVEFWSEKSTEAAKKGDDWGRKMADKKLRQAQNALAQI